MCLSIKYKAQCLKHHPERMSSSVKRSVCDYVRNPSRMQVPNYLCLSKMTLVSKKNLDNCPPI